MKIVTDENCNIEEVSIEKTNDIQNLVNDNLTDICQRVQQPGVSQLTPFLFVCGAGAAHPMALKALGITAIVNAAPELPDTPLPDSSTLYLRVQVLDRVDGLIHRHFDEVADLIEQVRMVGGRVVVHCVAGVSRSVSLCIAYLMKYQDMSLSSAFLHTRSRRQQARPNTGFFRQLISYESLIHGTSSVNMVYNEAACSEIPDVYEEDYRATLGYLQKRRRCPERR